MGKKKVKPNAFSTFMREYLEKERRAGRRYPKVKYEHIYLLHLNKKEFKRYNIVYQISHCKQPN